MLGPTGAVDHQVKGDGPVALGEHDGGAGQAAAVSGQDDAAPRRGALGHGEQLGIGQGRMVRRRGHPGHERRQRGALGFAQSVQLDHVHAGEGNPVR